jgi:hypothetical protein
MSLVPQDDRLYVCVDPSGGGFSETAVIAACLDASTNTLAVVSAEGYSPTSDAELETFLRGFMERLRSRFSNTTVIAIIESNFGGNVMASRIADVICDYQPVRVVSGDSTKHRRVGVVTTDVVKDRARVDVQRLLRTDALRFLFDHEFITGPTSGDETIVQKIRNQLLAFKYVYSERPNGVIKAALSGKGFGKNDDLVMAIMLVAFWSAYALSTPTCLI